MFKGLKDRLGRVKEKAKEELKDELDAVQDPAEAGAATVPATDSEGTQLDAELYSEGKGKKVREKKLDNILWELEIALLESDVALPVVEAVKEAVKEEILGRKLRKGMDLDEGIELILREAIERILAAEPLDFDRYVETAEKPLIIMFVGVNGTGKTTAIARIAHRLKKAGRTVVAAAADTFRAGAIEQLQIHCDNLGMKIIKHTSGSDPAAVAYDAIEHARARRKDVVLIDTAGRMQTNTNLMAEMKKIKRVADPDMIVFVGDSLAGNDAVVQAEEFNNAVGLDGVILTKIDADAKGGAALSIAHTIGKPVLFVGTGQEYEDLVAFNPKWMVDRLFEG